MLWSIDSCQKVSADQFHMTVSLYRWLKCSTHGGDVFLKLSAFNFFQDQVHDENNLLTSSVRSLQGDLRPKP